MGRSLKSVFTGFDLPEEQWDGLSFGELVAGDKYICLPIPGDNKGHGGFRKSHYLFQKIQSVQQDNCTYNSVELRHGRLSHVPDSISVIRIE